jgi:hypothetical protein
LSLGQEKANSIAFPQFSLICFDLQAKFDSGVRRRIPQKRFILVRSVDKFSVYILLSGIAVCRLDPSPLPRSTFVTLNPNMELPEFFIAPDESLLRLIPPGRSVFGSGPDEI